VSQLYLVTVQATRDPGTARMVMVTFVVLVELLDPQPDDPLGDDDRAAKAAIDKVRPLFHPDTFLQVLSAMEADRVVAE
jgi:ADP-ribose pyrophosphatase YjhB (NUDIX family)